MSSDLPLFRAEAYAAWRASHDGVPISLMPTSWSAMITLLLTLFGCMLWFLGTHTMVRRETAPGILSRSLGELRIVPPHAGVLIHLYVRDGAVVSAGQGLAYISTAQYLVDGGRMQVQVLAAISQERIALAAQINALDANAPTELAGQRARLVAERKHHADLVDLLRSKQRRLELAATTFEQAKRYYAEGALTGDSLRSSQYDWLSQQADVEEVQAQMADLNGTISGDEATLIELPKQQTKARAELLNQLAALQEKQLSTAGEEGYLITADVSGRITALQARVGQFVDSARPLMTLTPKDSALRAELYVPSRAIAFTKPGQRVRLMYDAFPYERFGLAYGTVREISSTVLKPDEVDAPVILKAPAYRVIVIPDRTTVDAYGVAVPLRAGMSLTADIILEQRSFLRLMLDPILAARGRLLGGQTHAK